MRPRLALVAAVVAGLGGTPAGAATRCVGEQTVFYACVTTPGVTLRDETYCVYTGGTTCTEVDVPVPGTSGSVGVTCASRTHLVVFLCSALGSR